MLHDELLPRAQSFPRPADANCYTPSLWVGAAAMAGEILRQDPDAVLASGQITEATTLAAQKTLYSAFARIVNTSLQRDKTGDSPSVSAGPVTRFGSCEKAETNFIEVRKTMLSHINETAARLPISASEIGWTIFYDGETAVGMRKQSKGVPSVLTFCEWAIGGVAYPPGSLLRALHQQTEKRALARVDEITAATFLRPSVFTVEPRNRSLGFYDGRPPSREGLMDLRLSAFRAVAQRILEASSVSV